MRKKKSDQQRAYEAITRGNNKLVEGTGYMAPFYDQSKSVNGMRESLNDAPVTVESPEERILKGIEFRTKGGGQIVRDRIYEELGRVTMNSYHEQQRIHEEREKSLYARIEKLEEALRLEQHRHFEDIRNFSGGCRPSIMGLAGERRG
jgi:ABC-type sugar transport system ATPase subunit